MNSRRLARLMEIICQIKAHPRRDPDDMCRRLQVSRRQFYKDRETLEEMGFSFHFVRKEGGFVLDKELTFQASGMSLADLFALMLGARALAQGDDLALALAGVSGVRSLVDQLPDSVRSLFQEALDKVVVGEGMSCRPAVLEVLPQAIEEQRQVVLVMAEGGGEDRVTVDPRRLLLRQGVLYLEAGGLQKDGLALVALSRVNRVILTPFFSPEG